MRLHLGVVRRMHRPRCLRHISLIRGVCARVMCCWGGGGLCEWPVRRALLRRPEAAGGAPMAALCIGMSCCHRSAAVVANTRAALTGGEAAWQRAATTVFIRATLRGVVCSLRGRAVAADCGCCWRPLQSCARSLLEQCGGRLPALAASALRLGEGQRGALVAPGRDRTMSGAVRQGAKTTGRTSRKQRARRS